MQNEPNLQKTKTSLTPYPKSNYAKQTALRPQKNKPNSNPIPNTPSAPRYPLPNPRPPKSAFGLLPATKIAIPPMSGFRNFALSFLTFDFSLLTLSPKSTKFSVSPHKLGAKTSKNHNPFAQNKPNPQTIKINLTLSLPMSYNNKPPHPTQKNKPNSNPIEPNSAARIDKTNPIQTQPNPIPASPKIPISNSKTHIHPKNQKISPKNSPHGPIFDPKINIPKYRTSRSIGNQPPIPKIPIHRESIVSCKSVSVIIPSYY